MKPKIKALIDQIESGKITTTKALILHHIKENDFSFISKMEYELRLPNQTLTARISDLEDVGLIYKKGEIKTGNRTMSRYYFQEDETKQEVLAKVRKQEKFEAAKRRMLTEFSELIHSDLRNALQQQSLF